MERHITTVTDRKNLAANFPLDIFVDILSPYLQVEDILALRRVNKYYFLLTHEPLIWKRYLKELRVLVPPIRPTLDYSAHATDYEFEQLVSRAISVEDNWRKQRPTIASYTFFDVGVEVSEMKLLPGGKYLVSLLKHDHRSFVTLDHLDHLDPPRRNPSLAFRAIRAGASQLQAKYMTYQGKPVVMIAFVTKETYRQPNTNSAQEGSGAQPQKVDVLNCFHVDLGALDSLAVAPQDPKTTRQQVPIERTIRRAMNTISLQVSLYSREGIAHVSVLQEAFSPDSQDFLLVLNLEHPREPSYVICECELRLYRLGSALWVPMTHQVTKQSIRAVRHLPEQNNLLIWRTIRTDLFGNGEGEEDHRKELMKMPEHTGTRTIFHSYPILDHLVLTYGKVDNVHITDDAWPYDAITDIPLQASSQPPPPISIFAEMSSPPEIHHWNFWPTRGLTREGPRYVYHPYPETFKLQTIDVSRPYTAHVLPGIFRSLIYTTEKSDVPGVSRSLVDLRRYISPESHALPDTVERHSTVERKAYRDVMSYQYTTFDVNPDVLSSYRTKGLGAIAWDHTIGRLCMTTAHGGVVQMIDFSHAAEPDDRFLMTSHGGFEHREDVD